MRVAGLDIRNPQGALVVRAPLALVSIDPWSLLRLSPTPRSIEFRDVQMTALVHRDGSIAFAASEPAHPGDTSPHTPPSVDAARGVVSPLSAATASIFGVVLDSAGVVGALDRARITNARLTLIDDDARERAVFEHVNGLFGRDPNQDARLFELRIDGPHGQWRFGGTLREAGGTRRTGIITLDDLPATDLLLLSGQSKLPVTTDLKLSARADVALDGGRIEAMKATLHTSDGTVLVEEKDFNPVTIESLKATVSWDEAARVMTLDGLDYRGAGNALNLTGTWAEAKPGEAFAWTATLSSRNATLRGAAAKDKPVTIAAMDGHLTGRAGGIAIDSFAMSGEGIHGNITGTLGTSADDDGLTLHVTASDSEARTALRLWPENIAPGARNYLVDELRAARIGAVDITVDMSGAELAAATRGDTMPDNAVHIDFRVSDATLEVSPDAPPLTKGNVAGTITGRTTRIKNVTADIRMADGRALGISEGAFVIPEITPEKVVAEIGLRLSGGADALAALLQTKMFKTLSGVDLDPATVKGQADLRIGFPLDLKRIPDLPDFAGRRHGHAERPRRRQGRRQGQARSRPLRRELRSARLRHEGRRQAGGRADRHRHASGQGGRHRRGSGQPDGRRRPAGAQGPADGTAIERADRGQGHDLAGQDRGDQAADPGRGGSRARRNRRPPAGPHQGGGQGGAPDLLPGGYRPRDGPARHRAGCRRGLGPREAPRSPGRAAWSGPT